MRLENGDAELQSSKKPEARSCITFIDNLTIEYTAKTALKQQVNAA